ncbi:helix-turn-helix transcriptional regulator [Streptomyces albiaxialis]|uniref:Helix-turn-helix transcriptional regulator n=1 Tax=Streptomyces albiaxialis TaxID=329523 RepID=A0ABN2VRU6_9ACTN
MAGLCGITEAYLSQIERGLKMPSVDVLLLISRELGVSLAVLLDGEQEHARAEACIAPTVTDALMRPPAVRASEAPAPSVLRERVEAAWRMWQTSESRFSEAARILPPLIADVELAARAHRSPGEASARREVLCCTADLYGLLRSYCRRTGRVDLSLMVADRARRAAEDADDPIRIAAAHWNLGHVLLADGDPAGAEAVAEHAIQQVRSTAPGEESPEAVAMVGALDLVAATSCTRRKRWDAATERLDHEAAPRARQVGEGNVQHTVFGPTNVTLHRLSIEMEAGHTAEALRIADEVDVRALPSRERQFTFMLDVARCYAQRREDAAVLVHLLEIETLAPEDLAHSREGRDLVRQLLDRARSTYRAPVSALAERLGML